MMNNTHTHFFIGDCSKGLIEALPGSRASELSLGILQRIAAAQESFEQATGRLIRLCELAYGARDFDVLAELSETLRAIPFAPAVRAATYYRAILLKRAGRLDEAAALLTPINAPRAIHTLGTVEEDRGNWREAARLHTEALAVARGRDAFTIASAGLQLAAIRSFEGDHAGSLAGFQSLWPMVRIAVRTHPHLYPLWCNALAVELGELGRVEEAKAASLVALASPLADRYPEWQATAVEVCEAERVTVAVVEPQPSKPRQAALFTGPFVTPHSSLVTYHLSAASHQRRAFGAPWAGLLERVKLSARDRDGPFVK